jgi:DNA adenine methylase
MTTARILRPAVKWHGGKYYLVRDHRIIDWLPDHRVYVEPFAGGLSVLLNKPRCAVEVASDLNADLIGFYRILRDRIEDLDRVLVDVEYSEASFEDDYSWVSNPPSPWRSPEGCTDDELQAAVRFLVRHRMSRGGLGREFAWSNRLRGGRPGDVNAWETLKRSVLPRIARRLRGVELLCQDALEVIRAHDGPDTLFYLDPPYPHSTRSVRDAYRHEMSQADHGRLIEAATRCRGMVVLSGYANELYDQALGDWDRDEFNMPNHAGQTRSKQRRLEVLWSSPSCRERPFRLCSH